MNKWRRVRFALLLLVLSSQPYFWWWPHHLKAKFNADFHQRFDAKIAELLPDFEQFGISTEGLRRECYGFISYEKARHCAEEMNKATAQLHAAARGAKSSLPELKTCVHCLAEGPSSPDSPSRCAVIHEPKSGCPKGYVKEADPRFTEKDGTRQYACVSSDDNKDSCTDVLMPGEKMELWFAIPTAPDVRPKT